MNEQLTIEGRKAVMLASELAELTGESVAEAVICAMQERLDAKRAMNAKVDRIMALAAEFRAGLTGPLPDIDALYDAETGLPI